MLAHPRWRGAHMEITRAFYPNMGSTPLPQG